MSIKSISFKALLLTAGIAINAYSQQDPLYSQYMFNQLAINPAYTGIHNNFNVAVNSRYQWGGLDGSPKTNTLTASSSFFGNKVGGGLILIHDRLGVNKNTEFHLSYAYKIQAGNNIFSFGLQTGIVHYKFDYNQLTLRFIDDPQFVPVSEGASKPNFGTGFVFMNQKMYLGFSIPRLLNSDFKDGVVSSTRYERHYYLTAAYILDLSTSIKFKPLVLLKAVDGAPASFDLNASVLILNKLWAGLFTRNFDTYGIMAQFELNDAYRLGYSFETPNGDFIASDLNTHEIMLSLDFALFSDHIVLKKYF